MAQNILDSIFFFPKRSHFSVLFVASPLGASRDKKSHM